MRGFMSVLCQYFCLCYVQLFMLVLCAVFMVADCAVCSALLASLVAGASWLDRSKVAEGRISTTV